VSECPCPKYFAEIPVTTKHNNGIHVEHGSSTNEGAPRKEGAGALRNPKTDQSRETAFPHLATEANGVMVRLPDSSRIADNIGRVPVCPSSSSIVCR
jgi:hypothetical protein